MVLTFKNAYNNGTLSINHFFGGNSQQFARVDLTIASIKGCEAVKETLEKNPDFKGKVLEVVEDTLNNKIFVKFTKEEEHEKVQYDVNTGDPSVVEVKEDYNYLLIIDKIDK